MSKDKLDEVYSIVTNLHDQGQMTGPVYMKAMLTLAADWAELEEYAECMMLVSKIDKGYVMAELPEHMKSDPEFGAAVHRLAKNLINAGMASADPVDPDSLLLSLIKPAQA